MWEHKSWNTFYQQASRGDLKRTNYQTEGSLPFHTLEDKRLKDTSKVLSALNPPATILSLAEGHSPRIWFPIDVWAYAGILDNESEKKIICIDPVYQNPNALPLYRENFLQSVSKSVRSCNDVQLVRRDEEQTPEGVRTESYQVTNCRSMKNLRFHFITARIPTVEKQNQYIESLIEEQRLWLNIHQLLNYLPWAIFQTYVSQFLHRTEVISFSNKVDADRDLLDMMDPERIRKNSVFFDWITAQGFVTIWEYPPASKRIDDDIGAIFVRKNL